MHLFGARNRSIEASVGGKVTTSGRESSQASAAPPERASPMDPLSDLTALSPRSNEPSHAVGGAVDEEVTSQQCSADLSAFGGLHRAPSVIISNRSSVFSRGDVSVRLEMDLSGSVSQLSQLGGPSQAASQLNEVFLDGTQHDEGETAVETQAVESKGEARSSEATNPQPQRESSGGFLSNLEVRWENSARRETSSLNRKDAVGHSSAFVSGQEESLDGCDKDLAGTEPGPVGDGANDDDDYPEATLPDERNMDDVRSETDYDRFDHRDSMDSCPETQPLEDFEEEGEENSGQGDDQCPSTEVLTDTMDDEPMAHETVTERRDDVEVPPRVDLSRTDRNQEVAGAPATPENVPTTSAIETSVDRRNRFLKRKQKMRDTLKHDDDAFVDTDDQTLLELSMRIGRERALKETKSSTTSNITPNTLFRHPDSQEELTPTQPSVETTSPSVPIALKKRGKANQLGAVELTEIQERSYEFVDSSCRCGRAICECASPAQSDKPPAKASSAIRNLELSFAIPESQDSESQQADSLPDLGALAFKTLEASRIAEQRNVAASSKRRADDAGADTNEAKMTLKRPKQSSSDSPSSVKGTPPASRKRGRAFLSPDAGVDSSLLSRSLERTPNKCIRSSKPPIAPSAPGLSTPSIRTRPRVLSPIPTVSSRSYLSRSKSLFKSKFDFCLTGFTGDGQENLTRLIEDYGGKVCGQDVLQKRNNDKVVVIATPVSWRKLKFMYAVACGIPVIHPEWIHRCIKDKQVVPFDGYCVPSGCSVLTGKFECLPVRELDIFKGMAFGIPLDVNPFDLTSTKGMSSLIAFILRSCGADNVYEDLLPSREHSVDVVLADEHTKVCDYYIRTHQASVKTFAWVTECMILQRFLEPKSIDFTPPHPRPTDPKHRSDVTVVAATAQIGDSDPLKLHTGELLLVDLSDGGKIDHFLLFDVCEILNIRISTGGETSKRKNGAGKTVRLQVGVLERRPNSPTLSRNHKRVVELSPEQVKRRVVAVSKSDFDGMRYRDESIFYYEDE